MLNAVCLANLRARRASITDNILFLSSDERAAGAFCPRLLWVHSDFQRPPLNVRFALCAFNRSVQHRLQSIGWRLEAQGLSRTLIEPQSNRVQITLRDAREIGSSREVLPQQAVGVLV